MAARCHITSGQVQGYLEVYGACWPLLHSVWVSKKQGTSSCYHSHSLH